MACSLLETNPKAYQEGAAMDPIPVYSILAKLTEGFRRSLRKTIA